MSTPTPDPQNPPTVRFRVWWIVAAVAVSGAISAGAAIGYASSHSDDGSTAATYQAAPSVAPTSTNPDTAFIADLRSSTTYSLTNSDDSLISLAGSTAKTFYPSMSDQEWRLNYGKVRDVLVSSNFPPDLAKDFIVKSVKYYDNDDVYRQTARLAATIVELKTKVPAGVYAVGTDIAPGTYKTSGGSHCYYEVRPSVTSTDIVDNDNLGGQGYFTVAAGQAVKVAGDCVFEKQN
jgi:hypothetical protein